MSYKNIVTLTIFMLRYKHLLVKHYFCMFWHFYRFLRIQDVFSQAACI
nr:MAG TPA: hypothetical protein [Caudoviricetes sp.]